MIKCVGPISGEFCYAMGPILECYKKWYTELCSDCYFTKTVLESVIFDLLEKKNQQ